jgi:hypothetical protein
LSSEKIWSNFANTEEGAEPVGLEVQEVKQEIGKKIGKKLFAMWISTRLSLQLASCLAHGS